jgi:signal transduction histidine kinase
LAHANPDEENSLKVVHLWVQDTGIGIPPEDLDKIFQQYYRTDASKDMASGTGLGLNITKSLVELQGGRIWFNSEVDKGSTFHFTTPIAETA